MSKTYNTLEEYLNSISSEEIQKVLDEWEADSYLSSIEANEPLI